VSQELITDCPAVARIAHRTTC